MSTVKEKKGIHSTALKTISLKTKVVNQNVGTLYMSYNYDQFKIMSGNRPTNNGHVQQLKRSFELRQLIVPVLVNDKMEIIDGQHRVEVCRQLGLPVYFIILQKYGIREVQMLNTNMKNWSVEDYLACYCNEGIEDYIKYREFRAKFGFDHQVSLAFLMGSTGKYHMIFNEGNLKVKSYEKAERAAQMISEFAHLYKGYKRKTFVFAMMAIMKNPEYNHQEMIDKVALQQTRLVDCPTVDTYISLMEELYNYHRAKSKRVLFTKGI
jgi:hypothetical protein